MLSFLLVVGGLMTAMAFDSLFDDDGEEWVVSDEAISTSLIEDNWENSDMWDEVQNNIVSMSGAPMTRKCMHMWGDRLCLCQFLGWMDSNKYRCAPSAGTVVAPPAAAYNDYSAAGIIDADYYDAEYEDSEYADDAEYDDYADYDAEYYDGDEDYEQSDIGDYFEDYDSEYADYAEYGDADDDDQEAVEGTEGQLELSDSLSESLESEWDDDASWDEISTLYGMDGTPIRRKCLHIWKHRLCLCQFLRWIDDESKYHCIYHQNEQSSPVVHHVVHHVETYHDGGYEGGGGGGGGPFAHQVNVHDVHHVTDQGPTQHIAVNHVHHIVHRERPGDVKVHHFHHVLDHGPVHHIPIRYVEDHGSAHGQYVDMQREHAQRAMRGLGAMHSKQLKKAMGKHHRMMA